MRKICKNAVFVAVGTLCFSVAVADDTGTVDGGQQGRATAIRRKKADKAVIELQEMTLTGIIVKVVRELKQGRPQKVLYFLETDDGAKIRLPTPRPSGRQSHNAEALDLALYEGRAVTVTCMGLLRRKGDATQTVVRSIASIVGAEQPATE